jgi:dephospho-CoA kinase
MDILSHLGVHRKLQITRTAMRDLVYNAPEAILLLRDITRGARSRQTEKRFISNLSHECVHP